jgi:hypothetical protein
VFGQAEQACRAVLANEEAAQELFGGHTAGRTGYFGGHGLPHRWCWRRPLQLRASFRHAGRCWLVR